MRRRFIWAAYGAVLIVGGLGLRHMWQYHYDMNLMASKEHIRESIRRVETLIDASANHINMLRISADDSLHDVREGGISVSPLYNQIFAAPEIDGYCSAAREHVHARPAVSLSGLGRLPQSDTPLANEINMALLLNPQFAATGENIPNLAWAYYTSARRFIAIYPFVACEDFHFTDDLFDHEFYVLGTPARNPDRRQFWTKAYMDEAGKGLMATIGAPIYEGGRFLGTVAIDLTLAVLSDYVKAPGDKLGSALIVNEQGQLLAHPTLIRPDDTAAHDIAEAFGGKVTDPMAILQETPDDSYVEHNGAMVYSSRLRGAPWRYVHISDATALDWRAILDSKVEIAGFLMLTLLIAAFDHSRRVGIKVKQHVEKLEQTQAKLQRAENDAHQANMAKSVMLANASHDLRTPLNAIIGFSEVVLSRLYGPIGSPKYEEYLRDIHASGNLLLAIVNDVLDLSKIEAGRYEMNEESIPIAKLMETSKNFVITQAERSGVELQVDVPASLPPLRADPRAMQQILLNLLSNAVKFTPAGGKVVFRAVRDADSGLRLEIVDTGKGIAAKDLPLLFTPFSRGASASTANTQGTGLGLTIVKSLVELHGGTIAIASTLGVGTSVTLTLPAERLGATAGDIAA